MSSLSAILTGIVVFILSQLAQRIFFYPIDNFKKIIGEIDYTLATRWEKIESSIGSEKERLRLSVDLEKQGQILYLSYRRIPFKTFLSRIRFLPTISDAKAATKALFLLSASLVNKPDDVENRKRWVDNVKKFLRLEITPR